MNIKQKFLIGFGVLLLLIGIAGGMMLRQVNRLGEAIDVILRENYQSVILCQNANETLDGIDNGLLSMFTLWRQNNRAFFEEQTDKLRTLWEAELKNITIPREGERAETVRKLLEDYTRVVAEIIRPECPMELRHALYLKKAHPLSNQIKQEITEILLLNQNNMSIANNIARNEAARLHHQGFILLILFLLFLLLFSLLLTHWIQRPLLKLIGMTNEIANGNLDLALNSKSNDEIGQLSRSFNAMTIALRNAHSKLEGKLHRSERINKDIFSELPSPIAVFDIRSERIELATRSAEQSFGMTEGKTLEEFSFDWLKEIFRKAKENGTPAISGRKEGIIQFFMDGKEYFLQPAAIPIPSEVPPEQKTGIVILLKDVTMAHEQKELKHSVISTVSHQLKTPLTSLQMSIYLLLEEKCGTLNPEQMDLVMAMQEDSRRLTEIIGDLLDLNKASADSTLKTELYSPATLLAEAKNRYQAECGEHSIRLEVECDPLAPNLPMALNRIHYALDNLIANAIRFTPPGGQITLRAKKRSGMVEFTVADTGKGMSKEVQQNIFTPFYRGPGQDSSSGIGLGLAIVKEIIAAHGGRIHVRSRENTGSVFTFTLPVEGETPC